LELNQVSHIISKATSKESWDELCCLYEAQDYVIKMYLKEWLTTLKMKEDESVTKHIHTFRSILDQLSAAGASLSDEDSVIALMRSMPPSFHNFLVSIRGQNLTLQTLITYLIQEETMLKSMDDSYNTNSPSTSTLAFGQKSWNPNLQKHPIHQYQNRYGNESYLGNKPQYGQKSQYQNKSYNNNFKQSKGSLNQTRFNNSSNQYCSYCGKPNHNKGIAIKEFMTKIIKVKITLTNATNNYFMLLH
jgi:hypothetical protein